MMDDKMIRLMSRKIIPVIAVLVVFLVQGLWQHVDAQIAVKGEMVYTVSGDPVENGVVLISDGKIEQVGSQAEVQIPDDYEVFESKIVTPGLIDSRSVVGLAGYYNEDHDQDQLETTHAVQPELRALDSYNAREFLVNYIKEEGITTVHTGHGPGAVISGQTMIVKTTGETVDKALVDSTTMLAVTLGPGIRSNFNTPGTRAKAVAMLRQELIRAQDYAHKRAAGEEQSRDLKMEILADLLDGKIKAMVSVHTARDIVTALRVQREFGFPMVLEGASEAYLVMDEIKEAGVPVIIHPKMIRPFGEAKNSSFETAAKLHEAGILVLFQSGYEGYVPKTRVAKFEAAIAAANGLGFENTLHALTLGAAELLGIDDLVGSIEAGKDADLVLFDGDPFEYLTNVEAVIIDGNVVHRRE